MNNELWKISENDLAQYGQCQNAMGRQAGLISAINFIRHESGEMFASRKDKDAKLLREIADRLEAQQTGGKPVVDKANKKQREIWKEVFKNPA